MHNRKPAIEPLGIDVFGEAVELIHRFKRLACEPIAEGGHEQQCERNAPNQNDDDGTKLLLDLALFACHLGSLTVQVFHHGEQDDNILLTSSAQVAAQEPLMP